jgi:hypothetical protein
LLHFTRRVISKRSWVIQRLSETTERLVVALHVMVDLLVEVLGPFGVAAIGGALLVIAFELVMWLIS